jgi:proline dehydrogenase
MSVTNPLKQKRSAPDPKISFEDTSIAFSSKSKKDLLKMYWLFASMNNQKLVKIGTSLVKTALNMHLPVKKLIKYTIFEHFCGGETIQDCEKTIAELGRYGIGTILDYSVEGEKTEAGFDRTMQETLATIEKASQSTHIPFSVFKVTGIASAELLEKVQQKIVLTADEQRAFERVKERFYSICRLAFEKKVKVFVDGEESWIQDTIDALTYEMMEQYNREQPIIYNTYQLYRSAALGNLKEASRTAEEKGYFLGAKLVRGAYMEKESKRAAERRYPDPIQPSKEATDRDFNSGIIFCLNQRSHLSFCLGTHNEASCYLLIDEMKKRSISSNDTDIWFAQLYGMSDNISYNLAAEGYNVAKYVPYGPVEAVMPYLFRRAEENTSVAGQTSREFNLIKKELTRRKQS